MTTSELLRSFGRLRALVVGDICLDRWCTYDPALSEPSRETGLDRIAVISEKQTAGGGGTVANNLVAMGLAHVAALGLADDRGHGADLLHALEKRGIDAAAVLRSPSVRTFTYTKLLNARTGAEDRPRIDFIQASPIPASLEIRIVDRLNEIHGRFDLIFVADQAETETGGVITEAVRLALAGIAREFPEKIIWADSRMRAELFRNVTLKVNQAEADAACRRAFAEVDYERLRRWVGARRLFITRGGDPTIVHEEGRVVLVPARRVENPVDICGAGDAFSSGAACALALGASAEEAAQAGSLVASATIMKQGTGTASIEELEHSLAGELSFRTGANPQAGQGGERL
jgi:bifunctional ADP-heptose synthase (sugar kinase/adenylyltransferase)